MDLVTMHGPEKDNYETSSIFKKVIPYKLVSWTRISLPLFETEVEFSKMDGSSTEISFCMIVQKKEECEKIKKFAGPKNEENYDRLEQVLLDLV